MINRTFKQIVLGMFAALLLITMPGYAMENFKVSEYGGGHQIWFEAEDFDQRNPDSDQYYPVVDQAGAFGRSVSRAGGAGGMIRWTFDISRAGGSGGTWYFWARQINPSNQSDYMLLDGDPADTPIPTGPPFPGGDGTAPFDNADDRIFEENVGSPGNWAWGRAGHGEGHTKQLQDGENSMYIFHRQGNNTVFWDVFVWTDSASYVPTDVDYQNAVAPLPVTSASKPSPADGSLYLDTWATLSWSPGETAASHDVYFGDNFNDVNDGAADTFRGNQTGTFFIVGFPGFAYPDGMVPGTTYSWRIDEVEANGATKYKGQVWSFTIPPQKAYDPSPPDRAEFVATDVTLRWMAGLKAKLHHVYFGDDPDVVANATGALPQSGTAYSPGPLQLDKTSYWRVDQFDGVAMHTGDVWSFTTLPDIPISDPSLVGWWKFDEGMGNVALDWSGHGNHGALRGDPQWAPGQVGGALAFDGAGDFVDCGNGPDLTLTGDITFMCWIKIAAFSRSWETILAKGDDSYRMSRGDEFGDSIHFGCNGPSGGNLNATAIVTTNSWRHVALMYDGSNKIIYIDGVEDARVASTGTINTSTYNFFIGENSQQRNRYLTGLVDDVRIYNKALTVDQIKEAMRGEPDLAWAPNPANGSTPSLTDATPLTWSPGDFAAEHDVYFGTDRSAVDDADASDRTGIYRGRQSATSYNPPEGVEWGGGPYYWRIDEVNTDGTISTGRIWTFTVLDFLLIEDFESYTDDDTAGQAIWQHWIDGFGVAENGSQVGYLLPPYAEQTIVHGGKQSMPLLYNNVGGVTNSEATLALRSPRDWTKDGVGELLLWFHGLPASVGSFVEAPAGTYTITAEGVDIWGTADQFHYAFKTLTGGGTIEARVLSVQNTDPWAKAGVMIRETLDAGSKFAAVYITPGNGCRFQARSTADAAATSDTSVATPQQIAITAPYWVKLERTVAGAFRGYYSSDGVNWQSMSWNPQSITMGSNVYIGLALTSHSAGVVCEAKFSNVRTTGTVGAQWAHQDIGLISNAAEPLYVALSNASGVPAAVAHDDPAAATIDAWTQWMIPLQAFADKGINLRNVDKIAIGLGSKSGVVTSGGSGTVYIDDIRLYRP
ncbi:MAG: hypothetical protein A2Z25_02600 [Planctomycetes bacterium RBG_16_55_9]|nr:MAG: hypothetical protein A2Z25_02600 [Planctomycetes bacterium RBG_16_55_9]